MTQALQGKVALITGAGRKLHALKLNKDGTPAHPLYLRGDLKPTPWGGA